MTYVRDTSPEEVRSVLRDAREHIQRLQSENDALRKAAPKAAPGDDLAAIEQEIAETCMNTPPGWRCTRKAGHDGPCAAVSCPEDLELVAGGMKRLRQAEPAPQQEAQEPVMIYHGRCTIDCGEHGHHDMEMLRMIPAGSKLYTAPRPAAPQAAPAVDEWVLRDKYKAAWLQEPEDSTVLEAYDRGWKDRAALAVQGGA